MVDSELSLTRRYPALRPLIARAPLTVWPSPVEPLQVDGSAIWVKRDDQSAPEYGGNKVRTLEILFGDALRRQITHVWSTGAYGSNHALATMVHAPRVGLNPGAMLFPQPHSASAVENLRATLSLPGQFVALPHWSVMPAALGLKTAADRVRGIKSLVMPPGGATPLGSLWYVSAAFELAEQVAAGELPMPETVVVGVGSTCTTAGLLVGFWLNSLAGGGARPTVLAARVTPWPVTAHRRIVSLALRSAALLRTLDPSIPAPSRNDLAVRLRVDGSALGRGYGRESDLGRAAAMAFERASGPALDPTYGAKSGAVLLRHLRSSPNGGPTLYWATKSTTPLPAGEPRNASPTIQRWLDREPRR